MTDRHAAYIVILDTDIREEDEGVLAALRMIRGVASVEPVTADPLAGQIAAGRRDREWLDRLGALAAGMTRKGT